jgi:hypothetical protein
MEQELENRMPEYLLIWNNVEREARTKVEYNRELDEAEAEFDKGDFISNEQMVKQLKQW